MKKIIFVTLLLLVTFTSKAVQLEIIAVDKTSQLILFNLKNGSNTVIKQAALAKGKKIIIDDVALTGMFTISNKLKSVYCYLPDNKKVVIEVSDNSIEILNPSSLNLKLQEWCEMSTPAKNISTHFYLDIDTVNDTEKSLSVLKNMRDSSVVFLKKCGNLKEEDYELIERIVKNDVNLFLLSYTRVPTIASRLVIPDWIREQVVSDELFASEEFLDYYPSIGRYVSDYLHFVNHTIKPKKVRDIDYLKSDRIKTFYLYRSACSYRTYNQYETMKKQYGYLFITPDEKAMLKELDEKFGAMKEGAKGYEFSFSDIDDKFIKLSDFRGKLVYIDIWATWCGPCKKEIPFLKKLEEKMHGKDIVFVSISVDDDTVKWKNFVKSQNLVGVHLNDLNKEMAKQYNFTGIPFFILIDKEGNIIETDAPRPSNPATVVLIEQWLNK